MSGSNATRSRLTVHLQAAIKQLIMERFDVFAAKRDQPPSPVEPPSAAEASNGDQQSQDAVAPAATSSYAGSASPQKRPPDSDELSDLPTKTPPAKKKKKDDDDDVDADAVYAAKLQAEENMRARPTRGANTRKAAPAKRKTKAKTSKKIKAEDDSDLDSGSETTKKEVKRSGGFHVCLWRWLLGYPMLTHIQKPLNLSPALSALLDGEMTVRFYSIFILGSRIMLTDAAFAAPNGQEALAIHPRSRAARPKRPTPNPM
jgi:upstream activation factor subunit UAF30